MGPSYYLIGRLLKSIMSQHTCEKGSAGHAVNTLEWKCDPLAHYGNFLKPSEATDTSGRYLLLQNLDFQTSQGLVTAHISGCLDIVLFCSFGSTSTQPPRRGG